MIFVSTGFHSEPFDRLLEWIDDIASNGLFNETFFVQKGYSKLLLAHCDSVEFLDMSEFESYARKCKLVITHGGTGTIMTSLQYEKMTIVVPRLKKYGEVCNNHQLDIAGELAKKGLVYLANSKEELILLVRELINKKQSAYIKNNKRMLELVSSFLKNIELVEC